MKVKIRQNQRFITRSVDLSHLALAHRLNYGQSDWVWWLQHLSLVYVEAAARGLLALNAKSWIVHGTQYRHVFPLQKSSSSRPKKQIIPKTDGTHSIADRDFRVMGYWHNSSIRRDDENLERPTTPDFLYGWTSFIDLIHIWRSHL